MADLVWQYAGESMPHIHGRRNHIDQSILLTAQSERAKAAKTWKISTDMYLKNQFANTPSNSQEMTRLINDITDPQLLEQVELALQVEWAKKLQESENAVINRANLDEALKAIAVSMRKDNRADKQNFINAFDNLLSIIDSQSKSIALWNTMSKNKKGGLVLNPDDIVAIAQLKKLMNKYLPALKSKSKSRQALSSEIGTSLFNNISSIVSENFAAGIVETINQASKTVEDVFKSVNGITIKQGNTTLTGAQPSTIESLDPITNKKIEKSIDVSTTKHVKISVEQNDKEDTYSIDMTFPASVKYYVSKDDWIHLSQYSGKNSILLDSLHDIYGANWDDETAYAIYNALAFSWAPELKGDAADKNYRIIRHDLILRTAYTYLAGSKKTMEGRAFYYNNRVYPILGILKAIYDKEINTTNIFNTSKSERYFDIYISHGGNANEWIPAPSDVGKPSRKYTPDKGAATVRIKKVLTACSRLLTRGSLKASILDEQMILPYLAYSPSIKIDIT